MKQFLFKTVCLVCLLLLFKSSFAQIGKCKGKYLGNIIAGSVPSNYSTYWNQVTSENASKWGSVEGTINQYNFGGSDICYNWAKNNNGIFKYHNLIWGGQTPGWVGTAATATITNNINPYFKAVSDHYAALGGLKMIDVLNEPVNTAMPGNLKAALTAGYQAEPANANDKNNTYGWAIWCFQVARKYFPDATLLINEYNIEMNWNNCRAPYIAMVQAIKNAPNLTDGQKNLIDGVGLQAHGIDNLTAANFKACIDEIWTKTGVAIHITEFDQTANPNEAKQQSVYSTLIPVAWEHPHVAGITLWGYIQGSTWIGGNGTLGPNGTDSGLLYSGNYSTKPYGERPAMTWLKSYFASQPSLSCCPAPGPFASCTSTNPLPVVSITSPVNNTVYTEGDNITINATATISSGSIAKVDFYQGATLLGSDASSPYTFTWNTVTAGNYAITAKATSALNASTASSIITIQVAKPVYQTGTAPVIDGTVEGLWNNFPSVSVTHVNSGAVSSASDLSGNWKAMWDATNLYVLVQVTDDVKHNDAGTDVYNDDNVEVYVDMGNTKATTYGTNDQQYTFRWNDATSAYEINGHSVAGIARGMTNTSTGYIMEISIPWSTIGGTAAINNLEGFEIMINDDDDGGARDGKMAWIALTDDTWSNPSLMGTIVLKGLNCTAPVATITASGATTFCSGGTVTLNASTGTGYSYVWKNGTTTLTGATASSYTATVAGSYSVMVTNSGGCSATSTATTVTVNTLPSAPTVAIPQIAYCQNATATQLSATGTGLKWYTQATAGTAITTAPTPLTTATGATTYYVSQTTNSCESARTMIAVTVNTLPSAPTVAIPQIAYCQNATATQLSATGTGLKWYTQATAGTATTTAPTPLTTATGTTTYYVSQTTNSCESARAMIAVTVNVLPSAIISAPTATTFCAGGSVVLTASAGSSYKWFNGTTQVGTASTYSATASGSYTVEVTNANSCKATSTGTIVTVNALPSAPTVSAPQITYCQNATATQLSATGTGLNWYTQATGGTATTTAPTPLTTATRATTYYVSQTTNNCEGPRAMITVTVNALPSATISTTTATTFCTGGSVVLTASVGSSYKWFNGTTQVGTASTYSATASGSYTVEVTNANTCKATSIGMVVTVNALPSAPTVVTPQIAYCQNATATPLTATGTGLNWYTQATGGTGTTTAQTPLTTATGTTTYYVSQTTNGCESSRAMIAVIVNALPSATITANGSTTIPQGGSVDLNANTGPGLSYKWFKGNVQVGTGLTYTATVAGVYTVEVTNGNNCSATSAGTNVNMNTNQPSVITITSPSPNSTVVGPITITVNVTDPDGSIILVEFLDGNTVIGTSTSTPYSYTWNNPTVGDHEITVRVTDSHGGVTTSTPVTTIVQTQTGIFTSSGNSTFTNIYPNPSLDVFTLKASAEIKSLSIVNMHGIELSTLQDIQAGEQIEIGKDLMAGSFVLLIKYASGKMEVAKLVKMK